MDQKILKALETWHGGDSLDARINMALSLMGEMGEVTNLYRKMFFKPGYEGLDRDIALDELGDVWYYIRIFAYLDNQHDLEPITNNSGSYGSSILHRDAIINVLTSLHELCLKVENWALQRHWFSTKELLGNLILQLSFLLRQWECSLDELTELNYQKLTKNEDHHGWKMGVDVASGESRASQGIAFFRREEDGSHTLLGTSQSLSEEDYTNIKDKLLFEKEVEPARNMLEDTLRKQEQEFLSPPLSTTTDLSEIITTGYEEESEDWREKMQKRIALQREHSIRNKGRWY